MCTAETGRRANSIFQGISLSSLFFSVCSLFSTVNSVILTKPTQILGGLFSFKYNAYKEFLMWGHAGDPRLRGKQDTALDVAPAGGAMLGAGAAQEGSSQGVGADGSGGKPLQSHPLRSMASPSCPLGATGPERGWLPSAGKLESVCHLMQWGGGERVSYSALLRSMSLFLPTPPPLPKTHFVTKISNIQKRRKNCAMTCPRHRFCNEQFY